MGRVEVSRVCASGILTRQKEGSTVPYDYTLNPYRGCAFGCSYCYVKRFQWGDDAQHRAETWGRWVEVKENAVALLQREMKRLYGKRLFFSSATDPYQPIERKLELTRTCLEALLWANPSRLHLQTRSPLVTRDLDLLLRFGDVAAVGISLATDDDEVRKVFEPAAPSVAQRLRTMRTLRNAGVKVLAAVAPVLPCDPARLADLIRENASGFWVDGLRYHRQDARLQALYRAHGWTRYLSRGHLDQVARALEAAFTAPSVRGHEGGLAPTER